jgi:hypothetical protein
MLVDSRRFPFTEAKPSIGIASHLPYLPLTLSHQDVAAWVRLAGHERNRQYVAS